LHGTSFEEVWSAQFLSSLLRTQGCFVVRAGPPSLPAGFVVVRTAADEAEILTLVVRAEVRRRGIARALVEAASEHAAKLGARVMFLEVGEKNEAARSLYRELGFGAVGERRGYYPASGGTPENALTLRSAIPLGKRQQVG
jgi:ribosomal-protein-alanine N-acetyltransferase